MLILDTNVISEARKGRRSNQGVQDFFQVADSNGLYICVQTIGEIRRGVENSRQRGDYMQAKVLESWLGGVIEDFANRILDFDVNCAQVWGRLMSPHPANPIDKQIAAIALVHNMTIVTRNVNDFRGTNVNLLNPFC